MKEEKKSLRKTMLENRRAIDINIKREYDSWICSELEKLILGRACKVIHSYIPFSTEINVYPLIQKLLALKLTIVCPKTIPKRKLENRILHSLQTKDLEVGIMGTKHPLQADVYEGKYDFIVVPGLAFDSSNYRLGYGGGYYDNFLVLQPEAYKVGIFYPFQKVEAVPLEPHDVSLDKILYKNI